jgi:hypothetical protein
MVNGGRLYLSVALSRQTKTDVDVEHLPVLITCEVSKVWGGHKASLTFYPPLSMPSTSTSPPYPTRLDTIVRPSISPSISTSHPSRRAVRQPSHAMTPTALSALFLHIVHALVFLHISPVRLPYHHPTASLANQGAARRPSCRKRRSVCAPQLTYGTFSLLFHILSVQEKSTDDSYIQPTVPTIIGK